MTVISNGVRLLQISQSGTNLVDEYYLRLSPPKFDSDTILYPWQYSTSMMVTVTGINEANDGSATYKLQKNQRFVFNNSR